MSQLRLQPAAIGTVRHPSLVWMALVWVVLGSIGLLSMLSGCNIVGGLVGTLAPPEKTKPQYTPPQQPLLVYVKSPYSSAAADELASVITEQLKEHKVAPVIETGGITELRSSKGTQFSKLSAIEVGRALGARQVLYVFIQTVDIDTIRGSDGYRGKLETHFKMIDVETGHVLWPTSEDYKTISKELEYTQHNDVANANQLRTMLLQNVGFRIARRFYEFRRDWDTDPVDDD